MATNKFIIGVSDFGVAKIADEPANGHISYGEKMETSTTNAISVNVDTANASADGDNKQVANITMVVGGTTEWTCWGMPEETQAEIYGHTYDEKKGVVEKMGDLAPAIGHWFIRTIADDQLVKGYEAHFYLKSQAVKTNQQTNTAGRSLTLTPTVVNLTIMEPVTSDPYHLHKEFTTLEAAQSYLDSILDGSIWTA